MNTTKLVVFISLIFALFCSFNQGQILNCVALRNCPSLLLLLQNRDELPNLTRIDVYRHLRSQSCGYDGPNPLVNCPDVEGNFFKVSR